MITYKLFLEPQAKSDIQHGIAYYNSQLPGLGQKFYLEVRAAFTVLNKNPYFRIKYNEVRCIPLKKFPYMIHYKIQEEINAITIYAVIHTSLDPEKNWQFKS